MIASRKHLRSWLMRQFLVSWAALLLAIAGCSHQADREPSGKSGTETCTKVSTKPLQTHDQGNEVNKVHRIELPERKGLRLLYHTDVLTFNTQGDGSLSPLTPQEVQEYSLEKSRRAISLLDEIAGTCLVLCYHDFGNGQKTFVLNREDNECLGWLLRGEFQEGDIHKKVKQFLVNQESSATALRLIGTVNITLQDGYVQRIGLVGVSTIAIIPPNKTTLQNQADFWAHQLTELNKRAVAAPDNELLKWGVHEAEGNVRHFERLLEKAAPSSPGQFTDGQITAVWALREPILRIDLP